MSDKTNPHPISRRDVFARVGKTAAISAALAPVLETVSSLPASAQGATTLKVDAPLKADAGVDRIAVLPGKTWLRGWVGTGEPPSTTRPRNRGGNPPAETPLDAPPRVRWSKASGPGDVRFADATALETNASFRTPGRYELRLEAESGASKASATLRVDVEQQPPPGALEPVEPAAFRISSPLWKARVRALIVNWIPHCIEQINRTDIEVGPGGIDNFVEAGKKLRGEPHGVHKGYVFSNAWVYQTIESISLALLFDAEGDAAILAAQQRMRETLEDWIPKILAAQEPDGYLQTAFTLPRAGRDGAVVDTSQFKHWDPAHRADHEGYVAGYLLEAAISHHRMTRGQDSRLYDAAKKLADCWDRNLGPAPKQAWYDDHQGIEQALVRFAYHVSATEGSGKGDRYIALAKFLLDNRYHAAVRGPRDRREYDQSHLPVVEQYEAVGHAVRAVYTYSAMADVAIETGDPDYRSAIRSVWDNVANRKRYVTGGIGSGETSEGFGPDYSLRHRSYCESCSSCGELFFQWKMHRIWRESRYADLYEETLYNALLGCMDLEARHFYYDNPMEARMARYRWHVCPCCVGNVPRTLLMLPTWAYTRSRDAIYVNLFVGSTVRIDGVAGAPVELVQESNYPWEGKVSITVNPGESRRFRLHLRIPNRNPSALYSGTPAVAAPPRIRVNDANVNVRADRNGYVVLNRSWKSGDRVELELPLEAQRVRADERVEATRGQVALRFGPLVYNVESEDQDITKALAPDAPLSTEWRPDLLGGVMVLRSRFADGTPLLAVPNFVRMNREAGLALPPQAPPPGPDGRRPPPPPPKSKVWITEG